MTFLSIFVISCLILCSFVGSTYGQNLLNHIWEKLNFDGERPFNVEDLKWKWRRNPVPFMVSLQHKGLLSENQCGGSIIGSKWILTAAHCVIYDNGTLIKNEEDLLVVAGITDLMESEYGYWYEVEQIYPFDPSGFFAHDIALIRLKNEIQFDKNVNKIDLPEQHTIGGENLIGMGWGIYAFYRLPNGELDPLQPPSILQFLSTKSITNSECESERGIGGLREDLICTIPKKGHGACKGDSGGPLINHSNEQVGIVSGGPYPCFDGNPTEYTRVFSYIDWINSHLQY